MKKKKKRILTILLVGILTSSIITVGSVNAATPADIEASIQLGVPWLAAQQNIDGSWGDYDKVARTGMAVVKLIDRAHDLEIDWFDSGYPYKTNIENGLNYLFSRAMILNPPSQTYGDPDSNSNDMAVYYSNPPRINYESAIALMAIGATNTPGFVVNKPGSTVDGWTYAAVVQDSVDFFAYSQCEIAPWRGGWGYYINTPGTQDNSVSGYVALALGYAKNHDASIVIPNFVLNELKTWISSIQAPAGYSYYRPIAGIYQTYADLLLKTGNLLYEMALVGYPVDNAQVVSALNWVEANWAMYDYQRAYCLMKGLEAYNIETLNVGGDPNYDWFDDMSTFIIGRQQIDGSFLPRDGHDTDSPYELTASWALLTLERATAPPANVPPTAAFITSMPPHVQGTPIVFTDLSTDDDGDVVAWSWDFGDSGTSSDQNPTHTYADDGAYTVTLTVTDDDDATDTTSMVVTVINIPPTAAFVTSAPPHMVGIPILFTDLSSDSDGIIMSWSWNFGDTGTSADQNPTHTYADSGTYTVTLTVTDDDDATDTASMEISVVSPKTMKMEAKGILESYQGPSDKHIDHDIEQAIWHIEKSLEPELWVDETHLTWQHGNKVFDEEKLAVKELLHIVEWKDAPEAAIDMAIEVIEILVEADEWLATVQYDEATAYATTHKQVDHQLEQALEEFANAADELATDKKGHPKYDDAINAYNKAWQHAGLAIQHATK